MILYLSVENFKAFKEKAEINFEADMRIKRLKCNILSVANKNIKKVAAIHGPNNTGKTCILLAIANLQNIMLNLPHESLHNFFGDDYKTTYVVKYIQNERMYEYEVVYDSLNHIYEYEKLTLLTPNESNKFCVNKNVIFEKSENMLMIGGKNKFNNNFIIGNTIPLLTAIRFDDNELFTNATKDYREFATSIELVRMGMNINLTNTLNLMKTDEKANRFIKEFVKNCDLNIDDMGVEDNPNNIAEMAASFSKQALNPNIDANDFKLWTKHQGKKVPSNWIDSIGTKKIMYLAGYIYEAISKGKILLIDEIDSSLHHILSRSIISLFNNDLNKKSQLIFSSHDALLIDTKKLLRTDQIWLTNINDETHSSEIFCLHDRFKSNTEDGIRGQEDICNFYLEGRFGSIPSIDLFDSLEVAVGDDHE